MQSLSSDIRIKIKQLCVDRYRSPGDFIEFTNKLISLGIIRQTYDVLENSLYFYSKDAMLYQLPASEIEKVAVGSGFVIGNTLDSGKVKIAIDNLDNKKLTVFEFHRELAKAGVVYVSVFLNKNRAYYFGQDGNYFLETY